MEDSQVVGADPTGVLVQNGVQVSYGATAAIERNVICLLYTSRCV